MTITPADVATDVFKVAFLCVLTVCVGAMLTQPQVQRAVIRERLSKGFRQNGGYKKR